MGIMTELPVLRLMILSIRIEVPLNLTPRPMLYMVQYSTLTY
jgi:hypothetical protein